MHFIYILFAEWKRHAAIPYSITVLQYYSISVYHFEIAIEVYYIYYIYNIYNKKFCNPQTKTVILYVRTLGQTKRDSLLSCLQSTFLGKESTISAKRSTFPRWASQPFQEKCKRFQENVNRNQEKTCFVTMLHCYIVTLRCFHCTVLPWK